MSKDRIELEIISFDPIGHIVNGIPCNALINFIIDDDNILENELDIIKE